MRMTLSIPDHLAKKFQVFVPARRRSKMVASLISAEMGKREKALKAACIAANKDKALSREINEWQQLEDKVEE